MAQAQESKREGNVQSCDEYFETIQSRKKLSPTLQESLTYAFVHIPVSSFPQVPGGKVIEIVADTTVLDAVKILSESNILSAPVVNPDAMNSKDWRERYLGIVDYSAIVLWVLQNAEIAAAALAASSAAAAGIGTGAAGALGALAFGATGPLAVAGLTAAAVGAAVAGGMAVIEMGSPTVKNFITQSAVIHDLQECKGRDWFDSITYHPISALGLPFMSSDQVVSVQSDELILEAFKKMKDKQIGGLPVVEGPNRKIIGNVSIRDIRFLLLKPELFASFRELTAKDFITTIGSATNNVGKIATPITCKPDSTLGSVIDTLATMAVYRIYVVSGLDNEVMGVITLRDVISCFITEPPNFFDDYFGFAAKETLNK